MLQLQHHSINFLLVFNQSTVIQQSVSTAATRHLNNNNKCQFIRQWYFIV